MSAGNGGPAFPGLHPSAECRYREDGMNLRDYFAAKAMPMVAAEFYAQRQVLESGTVPQLAAKVACEFADAMLAERLKTPTTTKEI